jgi:hypothetical protein
LIELVRAGRLLSQNHVRTIYLYFGERFEAVPNSVHFVARHRQHIAVKRASALVVFD